MTSQSPALVLLGSLLAFLAMSTQLPLPMIDKAALGLFTVLLLLVSGGVAGGLVVTAFLIYCLFFASFLTSLLLNYGAVTKDAFVLLFYLSATFLVVSLKEPGFFLRCAHNALLASAGSGLLFFALSWLTHRELFVTPLWSKGLPDVYAASGFTTTPQVFGTYCALLLVTSSLPGGGGESSRGGKLRAGLAVLGLFASLNRVWLIFLGLLLARRHLLLLLGGALLVGAAALWLRAVDLTLFLVLQTLSSRLEMIRQLIEFYLKQDLWVQLVGNLFFSQSYFTLYGREIAYLENGQLFLLNKLGALGLASYLIFVIHLLGQTWRRRRELFPFACYYLVLAQFMTHEFLSFSFWLFTMMLFLLLRSVPEPEALPRQARVEAEPPLPEPCTDRFTLEKESP